MTIGRKIALTNTTVVAFSLAIGLIGAYQINAINSSMQGMLTDSLPGVETIGKIAAIVPEIRANSWKHLAADQAGKADADREIERLKSQLAAALNEYEPTIHTARDRELFSQLRPSVDEFLSELQSGMALSREGKMQEALAAFSQRVAPVHKKLSGTLTDLVELNRTQGRANADASSGSVASAKLWIWTLVVLGAVVSAALAWLNVRNVNAVLGRIAAELSDNADHITSAASQVASSSQSLAQASSEQAASIEETSASTEEINSMTRKNAESAKAASELMAKAVSLVGTVNHAHQELGRSIGQVNESSDKVSKIIKAIDEIAFQTNILALNAAVEAARAGEAGQGFAVVADEVRNLARRSADAAKETAVLIEESITRAREGKMKLGQVLTAMDANNQIAGDVKTNVDEVSLGSQEQARGLDQIAKAVAQMDQVIQRAAASAEEGASAGEELAAQAESMRDAVKRLRLLVHAV